MTEWRKYPVIMYRKTDVFLTTTITMELEILNRVHETFHGHAWLTYLMKYISYLGEGGIACIAVCVLLLVFRKTRTAGVAMAFALILDYIVINVILKNAVGRERPWTHDGFLCSSVCYEKYGIPLPDDASFPSGHTGITFAAAVVLLIFYKKKAAPAIILAFLVAVSRIYLCVHFPSDVLAGMVLGSLCGVAGYFVYKGLKKLVFFLCSKYRYVVMARIFRVRIPVRGKPRTTSIINSKMRKRRVF